MRPDGHYQDNRAEYLFGHVPELIQAGIVGAMFMAGNAGNTTNNDARADGITNPPSFCTTDGISSGQMCNNHTSTVADDDGGFVRSRAVASPGSVAPGGTASISTSVSSTQASTVLVDLEVYGPAGNKVFQQFWDNQPFTAGQTRTYASSWSPPSTTASGAYSIAVGVFSPGWGTLQQLHRQNRHLLVRLGHALQLEQPGGHLHRDLARRPKTCLPFCLSDLLNTCSTLA